MSKRIYHPTAERDVKLDVPRRIYRSTIERIDKHLVDRSRPAKMNKKNFIKADFNKFLITMLDTYEYLQTVKTYFALELFDDIESARGEAIKKSVKTKSKPIAPTEVLIIGPDEELWILI